MSEQDAGTLTTLTLTIRERNVVAHSLTMTAVMLDALDDTEGAGDVLAIWERIAPDYA